MTQHDKLTEARGVFYHGPGLALVFWFTVIVLWRIL
jgi:hypothetical protein